MTLPPSRDHRIDLARARQLIQARRQNGAASKVNGGGFGREAIDALLAQPGCAGIRFYFAQHDDGTEAIVLVGVDEQGTDMAAGVLVNDHYLCPPWCPPDSPLNT